MDGNKKGGSRYEKTSISKRKDADGTRRRKKEGEKRQGNCWPKDGIATAIKKEKKIGHSKGGKRASRCATETKNVGKGGEGNIITKKKNERAKESRQRGRERPWIKG